MSIKELPSSAVRLIGSTQVITSVYSVVKELVENCLDAQATSIEVKLENFGIDKIEVRDNGHGISPQDVSVVGKPHYTSKLTTTDELSSLVTYGFRGEALGCLCAVSEVAITTKTSSDDVSFAYCLDYKGDVTSKKPSHLPQGTTVSAANLFKNLPVRKQYYGTEKKKKEALKKVEDLVTSYALIRPDVRFVLKHNKDTLWQKNACNDYKLVLSSILGSQLMAQLEHHVKECAEPQVTIELYLPKMLSNVSETSRCSTEKCFTFVNKRPVMCKDVEKLLKKCYSAGYNLVTPRYPVGFVHLQLPPSELDVNLDPNKTTVMLHSKAAILNFLESILNEIYTKEDVAEESGAKDNVNISMPLAAQPNKFEDKLRNADVSRGVNKNLKMNEEHSRIETVDLEQNKQRSEEVRTWSKQPNVEVSLSPEIISELDLPFTEQEDTACANVPENVLTAPAQAYSVKETSREIRGDVFPVEQTTSGSGSVSNFEVDAASTEQRTESVKRGFCGPVFEENLASSASTINATTQAQVTTPSPTTSGVENQNVDSQKYTSSSLVAGNILKSPVEALNLTEISTPTRSDVFPVQQTTSSSDIGNKVLMNAVTSTQIDESSKQVPGASTSPQSRNLSEINTVKPAQLLHGLSTVLQPQRLSSPQTPASAVRQASKKRKLEPGKNQRNIQAMLTSPKPPHKPSTCSRPLNTKTAVFSMKALKESLRQYSSQNSQNWSQTAGSKLKVIGCLESQSLWIGQFENNIVCFQPMRVQEQLLFQKLMQTYTLPLETLDVPIKICPSNCGGEAKWCVLMSCGKTEGDSQDAYVHFTDPCIVKNGFRIRQAKDNSSVVEIVAMTSCVNYFGLNELKEILGIISARAGSKAITLEQSRPTKTQHFLQGEAVRMTRTLPLQMQRDEVEHLAQQCSTNLLPQTTKCFHNKPFILPVYDLNYIQVSQTYSQESTMM